jgi:hypothetical protein
MEDKFLKIFVRQILKLNEDEFDLSNCEVIPNEFNKTEYKEIDILIINKRKSRQLSLKIKCLQKTAIMKMQIQVIKNN